MRASVIFILLMAMLFQSVQAQDTNRPKMDAEGKVIAPELPAPRIDRFCKGAPPPEGVHIFKWAEEMPTLKEVGCDTLSDYEQRRLCSDNQMRSILAHSITLPPEVNHSSGCYTIYISFVITKEGEMSALQVAKSFPDLASLKRHTLNGLREVAAEYHWQPGKMRGKPVNVQMIVPIRIRLK